jgi:hypothetical protein
VISESKNGDVAFFDVFDEAARIVATVRKARVHMKISKHGNLLVIAYKNKKALVFTRAFWS